MFLYSMANVPEIYLDLFERRVVMHFHLFCFARITEFTGYCLFLIYFLNNEMIQSETVLRIM